jgi:ubiquinone/menaquinone biosynthesis C-methylase UbiE
MRHKSGKSTMFDTLAESYYSFVPSLPKEYIELLKKTFLLKQESKIIDLGCGSGDLALAISNYSSFVEGVDVSGKMIEMAKEKDKNKRVKWIEASVDGFDFQEDKYKLIFAFESFHLFTSQEQLIKSCVRSLKKDGSLCIGWAEYEWEPILRASIIEVFTAYGVLWEEWGIWTCPKLATQIADTGVGLNSPKKKTIVMRTSTPIMQIINYLFSISLTAYLNKSLKAKITEELLDKFTKIFPSGVSEGYSYYNILYSSNNYISKSNFSQNYLEV